MSHTPGPWTASQYLDTDEWGVLSAKNEIVVGLSSRLHPDNVRLIAAAPELLEACKAQHEAMDWLFAVLIGLDTNFFPSQSPAWPAIILGNEAIRKAEGRRQSEDKG